MWVKNRGTGCLLSEQGSDKLNETWFYSQIEFFKSSIKMGVWDGQEISPIIESVFNFSDTWSYIGLVYDGTSLKSYINGQISNQFDATRIAPYNSGLGLYYAIAASTPTNMGNGAGLTVDFATLQIWNRSLTNIEINNNYLNSVSTFYCPTPTPTETPTPTPTPTIDPYYYYYANTYICGSPCSNTGLSGIKSTTPLVIGRFYKNPNNLSQSLEIVEITTAQNFGIVFESEPIMYLTCGDACVG